MEQEKQKSPSASLYDELDRTMWITKHSRFNAAYRLKRKSSLSIYSISILSVYVLSITLLEKYGFQVNYNNLYGLISIMLSVFILVLSLSEASKNYGVSSERLFVCGNEIRNLLDNLKMYCNKRDDDLSGIYEISHKYSSVLSACGENHEKIDSDLHRAEYYKNFNDMNLFWAIVYRLKFHISIYWFYASLIVLPPVFFWRLI
jgi:hypothetical protein